MGDQRSFLERFEDRPALPWIPISSCAILGAGFLAVGVWLSIHYGLSLPALAAIVTGTVGVGAIWAFSGYAERISVVINSRDGRIELTGCLPWRERRASWAFNDVEAIEAESWDDGDGVRYRPVLLLKSGHRIPMIANWHRSRDFTDRLCAASRNLPKE